MRNAETGVAISNALVTVQRPDSTRIATTMTDARGAFEIRVSASGDYLLEVTHLGYEGTEFLPIQLHSGESLYLELRLSRSVLRIDPIDVTVRRPDPYLDISFAGALYRRDVLPSLGSRRVVLEDDPEMRGAMRISEVIRWFTGRPDCVILYYDGRLVHGTGMQEFWLNTSAANLRALEWYRRYDDAPHTMRRWPSNVGDPYFCSVVALWPK